MKVVSENDAGHRDRHIEELHQIWGTIYETVGLKEGLDSEALRFAATLRDHRRSILNEEKSVNKLMTEVGTNAATTIEISNWVLDVTKALKCVHDVFSPSKDVVIDIIQVRLLATAIFLRKFPSEEERKLLDQWEKTSFRIFGLCRGFRGYHITAQTKRSDYIILARQVKNSTKLSTNEILQQIKTLGGRYSFVSDSIAAEYDCYTGWAKELRYMFYRYEQDLAEKLGKFFSHTEWNSIWKEKDAVKSIEHIHPQSKSRQIGISVHRIGNLLLLPPDVNSSLRDKDPEEKTQAYRNTRLLQAEAVAKTIESVGWDDEAIAGRSYEIAEWIDKTFND